VEKHVPRAMILVLISGIINCLLAVVHQIVLYSTYAEYKALITPQAAPVLADFLLFSIGLGIVLLFVGALAIYCYGGLKRGERWAYVIAGGAALLLFALATTIGCVIGFDQAVSLIHFFDGLLIAIPLIINRRYFM
jgi:hypothetical protein